MRAPLLALLFAACSVAGSTSLDLDAPEELAMIEELGPDPFAAYLAQDLPVADGFSEPVTGSWERCGDGCWERAKPRAVTAIAAGVVEASADGALRLRHRWYEDQVPREVVSVWRGLDASLPAGARVERGASLGLATRLELSLDPPEPSTELFLAARPSLHIPQREQTLALVSHDRRQMRIYQGGVEAGRYNVSFGQQAGDKERRGDNRTPKGMYFVTQRSRGPFAGDYASYYGGIWLRLNYPNAWDAARGVDQGLITVAEQVSISRAWRARQTTLQGTRLGSGIGMHAWAYEWDDAGLRYLSWGCLVVHVADAEAIYAALPEGSMVILF